MLEPAPQLLSSSSELLSSPSLPDPISLVVGIGKLNGQGIDLQVSEISTPATIVVFVLSAAFILSYNNIYSMFLSHLLL